MIDDHDLRAPAGAPVAQPAAPLLDVEGLTTWFASDRGIIHAVDDVSFHVGRGETLGIVGESGSGKSVLCRTVMQLTPKSALTRGTVMFDGRDLRAMSKREAASRWGKDISMVFQDPMTSLNPVRRIGDQISEVLELHLALRGKAAQSRALELLHEVGISDPRRRLRAYPHEMSGGMRQRVCIAIAIACSPTLLFADEPTTALDVTIQRQILDLLTSLQRRNGMAMVLVSHDLGVVARRTHRIAVMYGGRVVETGSTKSLFGEMRHPYTASLLASIPRLENPVHSRLEVIPGRPVDVIDPKPGCRFAPRCRFAQARCLEETPPLVPASDPTHTFACFFPLGSEAGEAALAANRSAGVTAAGLRLDAATEVAA